MIRTLFVADCPVPSGTILRFTKSTTMSMMPQVGTEYLDTRLGRESHWPFIVLEVLWGTEPEWMEIRLGIGEALSGFATLLGERPVINRFEESGWTRVNDSVVEEDSDDNLCSES